MLSSGLNFWEMHICWLCFPTEHTLLLSTGNDHLKLSQLIIPNIMSKCTKCGGPTPMPLPYTTVANQGDLATGKVPLGHSDCTVDMNRVCSTYRRLKECGFYYEGLYMSDAAKLLDQKPVGTFLIRASADPRYLFAVSVQTERGPTNIRIHYAHGFFRLDAEVILIDTMPRFECVLSLVDYYVKLSATDKAKSHVWLDQTGRRDLHIRLCRPLYSRVMSLQHLCRTTIGKFVDQRLIEQLPVPKAITSYLRDYPYPQ